MRHTFLGTVVLFTIASSAALLPSAASAQFSTDPLAPLALSATAADDVQPKIAAAPDGGHYVSFFSGTGYDVMLTRLAADGSAVWKAGSILVKDRASSSTTDYGLASDALGNAYVAYDMPTGIEVAAFASNGTLSWTKVVTASADAMVGRVNVASDGAIWVAHNQGATTRVQRFDAAGTATFATPLTISETGATQWASDLQPSTNGAMIISCHRYVTFMGAKILRAHRIEADGTKPWAAIGVSVFTTGSLQIANFPTFIPDGSGGAYFCWYTTTPLQSMVQHMTAAGTMDYGVAGLAVTSTATGYNRTGPSMVLGSDSKLYVFWSQQVPNTSNYGVFGQCFSKGARQWGTNGVAVEPMSTTMYSRDFATATRVGDGVACHYVENISAVTARIRTAGVSGAGAVLWTSDLATNGGTKYRLSSASAAESGSLLVWQGGSTGASDVFAARIGADGVVGPPASGGVIGDLDGDGVVAASDLSILLSQWGASGTADLDSDGVVGAADLSILLGAWS